jgi:hypothetical protein
MRVTIGRLGITYKRFASGQRTLFIGFAPKGRK